MRTTYSLTMLDSDFLSDIDICVHWCTYICCVDVIDVDSYRLEGSGRRKRMVYPHKRGNAMRRED